MENLVAILDSYTYNSLSNKVSWKVVKKVNIVENIEEEITEQQVLMEDTYVDPMETAVANQALSIETEENVDTMTWTSQLHEI